jgi:hypothetical protein
MQRSKRPRPKRPRRSAWRRMGDSNSRGVAPNTLSNNADLCPPGSATVRDLPGCLGRGRRRTVPDVGE